MLIAIEPVYMANIFPFKIVVQGKGFEPSNTYVTGP